MNGSSVELMPGIKPPYERNRIKIWEDTGNNKKYVLFSVKMQTLTHNNSQKGMREEIQRYQLLASAMSFMDT